MDAKQLKELIEYHDNLYYNEGRTEITDAEYDALRQQLFDLDKGELDYVPGAPTGLFPKYTHTHPIASLSKINDEESLRKEFQRLAPVILMPKYDGLTIVVYPDAAVTRGSGEIGDDISVNFDKICNISLDQPVRGEAIISRDDFEALNMQRKKDGKPLFENRRNAVAGILRSKEGKYLEFVRFVAYNIVGSSLKIEQQISVLRHAEFNVTDYWVFSKHMENELVEFIKDFDRDKYLYEIDGMVLKSNIEDSEAIFGRTSHHPKDAAAFKFAAEGGWTKLRNIVWTVGRTGRVTPNAVFEPISILDTTVRRASLHNPAIMSALNLSKGCDIYVIKANDIIPAVIESKGYNPLNVFPIPDRCPVCETFVEKVNDQLFCPNEECNARIVEQVASMASRERLNIDGLSVQTIEKLKAEFGIYAPTDIFSFTKEDLMKLPGFAEKSAEKLYNAIQNARIQPFDRVVVAAGIPLIGRTASKEMAKIYSSWDELVEDKNNGFKKLAQVDGFGKGMLDSLIENYDKIHALSLQMQSIEFKEKEESSGNKFVIAITGKFDNTRDYYVDLIEQAGHEFSKSVTKKTTHLFAGEKAGSKIEKAQKAGVAILTSEEELRELII